jgi:valyl-tRNA synthetase
MSQQLQQLVAPVIAGKMQVCSPMYATCGMQQQLYPQSQAIHHAPQQQQVQVSVNQRQETTSVIQIVQQIKKQSVEIQQENSKNETTLTVLRLNSSSKTVKVMNPVIQSIEPIKPIEPIEQIAVKRSFILDISDSCACSSAKKQIIIID